MQIPVLEERRRPIKNLLRLAMQGEKLAAASPLSVAEALPWHQSEGNVDLLADYANFTIEGINHLYGSPGKRLRKNPSLSQRAAQHKIFDKIERIHVFDQKTALKLARLDADDDSPPPASRLIASAFDIKENCGSVNAMRLIPKEHRQTIRSGLVDSSVNGLHKFAEYSLLVVRQLHARRVHLRCRVSGGGAILPVGKKESESFVRLGMVLVSLVPLPSLRHPHICSHQMPCCIWNVRLVSSFD